MNIKLDKRTTELTHQILGGIFFPNSDCASLAVGKITSDMLSRPEHAVVWQVIERRYLSGLPLDIIQVHAEAEKLNPDVSIALLMGCVDALGGTWSFKEWVEELIAIHWQKKMDAHSVWLQGAVGNLSLEEILDKTQGIITDAQSQIMSANSGSVVSIEDATKDAISVSISRFRKEIPPAVMSGYSDLDRAIGGFEPGMVTILAGRPGTGKTSMALNLMENISLGSANKKSMIFSLEMGKEQLTHRFISSMGDVNQLKIRQGSISPDEWQAIEIKIGRLFSKSIYICDLARLTPASLLSALKTQKAVHGLDIAFVDYLQLMDCGRHPLPQSRNEEISIISKSLKAIAKEVKIPIICLSQLTRAGERDNRRPRLHDLRDSGSIEQDADNVLFLYRKPEGEGERPEASAGIATELIIAKNRCGPLGTVDMVFLGKRTRFEMAVRDLPRTKEIKDWVK